MSGDWKSGANLSPLELAIILILTVLPEPRGG